VRIHAPRGEKSLCPSPGNCTSGKIDGRLEGRGAAELGVRSETKRTDRVFKIEKQGERGQAQKHRTTVVREGGV